jgi:hypothetical protein
MAIAMFYSLHRLNSYPGSRPLPNSLALSSLSVTFAYVPLLLLVTAYKTCAPAAAIYCQQALSNEPRDRAPVCDLLDRLVLDPRIP